MDQFSSPQQSLAPDMVGREADFTWFEQSLREARVPGLLLIGPSGIGKTTLAQAIVRQHVASNASVVNLDLRTMSRRTTEELLKQSLNQLFPNAADADPYLELSRRFVTDPALLVFDHLDELCDYEQVAMARFISYLPRTRAHVVMISDAPLKTLAAERTVVVRHMETGLSPSESRQMVLNVARQTECDSGVSIATAETGPDSELMLRLARILEGHPLLIRLAVGLTATTPRALTLLLATAPESLADKTAATVTAAVQALPAEGRRVLALLRFFPTGFLSEEALRAVCLAVIEAEQQSVGQASASASGLDVAWCVRGPQQLVKHGFLTPASESGFLMCHPLIHQEASKQTLANRSGGHITLRLLMAYTSLAERHQNEPQKLAMVADAASLLMEGFWSQRTKLSPVDRLLVDLVEALDRFWIHGRRGLHALWLQRVEAMTQSSKPAATSQRPTTPPLQSSDVAVEGQAAKPADETSRTTESATSNQADLRALVGRFTEVLQDWSGLTETDRARRWAQLAIQHVDAEALALLWLAHSVTCFQSGDGAGCDAALKQADQIATDAGRKDIAALVVSLAEQRSGAQASAGVVQQLLHPGLKFLEKGNATDALPHLNHALAAAREQRHPVLIASCLFYLGRAYYLLADLPNSLRSLNEALEFAEVAQEPKLIEAIDDVLRRVRRI